MSTLAIPVPRVIPGDAEVLERRARALAGAGAVLQENDLGALWIVCFHLRGALCALETARVERAISRLTAAIAVPRTDGSDRTVTFVDERPLPVVDLAGFALGEQRRASDLLGDPALVVATQAGSVAMIVGGPLELARDELTAKLGEDARDGAIRITGRLSGGALLLDHAWLLAWAASAVNA